jgi:DNA-binding XRE family transcriptional regulator
LNFVNSVEEKIGGVPDGCFIAHMAQLKRKPIRPLDPRSLEAIGQRLLLSREALGYGDRRQSAFAREISIDPPRYNNWERGNARISIDGAIALCGRFGLTLDWIYLGDRSGLPARIAEQLPPNTL